MLRRSGVVGILVGVAALLTLAPFAQASVSERGFITARDGTKLRYSVVRPDGPGPFPVLINYQGYGAGSTPGDNGVSTYLDRLLARGYAVMGVSVRGTGCSEGMFDPFAPSMGQDGYDSVEWAASQPWANGRVGMIGVSFGGITQPLTAALRPPHLSAIVPSSALSDLYRDVAYPGGILEYDFPFAWTAIQKGSYAEALPDDPDPQCAVIYAQHEQANATPDGFIPTLIAQGPFFDDRGGLWGQRAPNAGFHSIEVPTFLFNAWQDEQLPGRIFESLGMFAHPDRVWANFSNGNHGRDYYSATDQQLTLDFLDHFVRRVGNGFESRVPHLTLAMDTAIDRDGKQNEPAWNVTRSSIDDLGAQGRAFYLRSDGHLSVFKPTASERGDTYNYPQPSSDVTEPGPAASLGPVGAHSAGQLTWKGAVPPGGALAYTTAPLTRDLLVAGPASLDVWLSSTATDTDLQATITEIRPDGQETYVQRGWLRASHRKLDASRSTTLRPYQTHFRGDAAPLTPGQATPMRLEVFPFAHAFRFGSRIRVWIEAPTGHTGFWAFTPVADLAQNTILHDPGHPSRLMLGDLPGERARAAMPGCDTLRNQPCRSDPAPNNWTGPGENIAADGEQKCGELSPHAYIVRRTLRRSRRGFSVRGHAFGRCAPTTGGRRPQVTRVRVAVARITGRRCRFVSARGRLSRLRSCRRPIALLVRGTTTWRLSKRARLQRGHYRLYAWAYDSSGRREAMSKRQNARFTVR